MKKVTANRFGLIALMSVSLFVSTAFAGNAPAPTQVVVTNTPAQPVPVVGLVKDADASARKPFQWFGTLSQTGAGSNAVLKVTTTPANQRLVIEDVSGYCQGGTWILGLDSYSAGKGYAAMHYLPATFWNGSGPASTPVRFYVDPGFDLNFTMGWTAATTCNLAISGYFVDLP
jgi:hypothetical protein